MVQLLSTAQSELSMIQLTISGYSLSNIEGPLLLSWARFSLKMPAMVFFSFSFTTRGVPWSRSPGNIDSSNVKLKKIRFERLGCRRKSHKGRLVTQRSFIDHRFSIINIFSLELTINLVDPPSHHHLPTASLKLIMGQVR